MQSGDPGYIEDQTHGIIAAIDDESLITEWGCIGTLLSGADGIVIGTGAQNTFDIVTGCTTQGTAAKLCYDLVSDGYSDWYLPSKDELNKVFLMKEIIGGFAETYYWSSTDVSTTHAWAQRFSTSVQIIDAKSNIHSVRAVRSF